MNVKICPICGRRLAGSIKKHLEWTHPKDDWSGPLKQLFGNK